MNNCPICNVIDGKKELLNRVENTVLYENENFVVLPELGSFAKRQCLIFPREHLLSSAYQTGQQNTEFVNLTESLRKQFYDKFKENFILFEHGSGLDTVKTSDDSILHGHTHLIPGLTWQKVLDELSKHYKMSPMIFLEKIKNYEDANFNLLHGENGEAFINNEKWSSQFIRLISCMLMDIPLEHHNWRKHKFIGNIKETINDFQDIRKTLG